jgi:hypothetical protein
MKRVVLLAVLAATTLPATAHAAVPCRVRIYNDWYADGKIASTYPLGCYRDALEHMPPDAKIYSNLADDIKSAMRAAEERLHGDTRVPAQVGKGNTSAGAVRGVTATLHKTKTSTTVITKSPKPAIEPVVDTTPTRTVAVGRPASGSTGIPTPIIVLGALALLLAAIGAAGAGVRHHRRGR